MFVQNNVILDTSFSKDKRFKNIDHNNIWKIGTDLFDADWPISTNICIIWPKP